MNNPIHDDIKKLNELLCNVSLPDVFTFPGKERAELALKLIKEEGEETIQATLDGDVKMICDGVADLRVVIHGAAVWFGINLDAFMSSTEESPAEIALNTREEGASKEDTYKMAAYEFRHYFETFLALCTRLTTAQDLQYETKEALLPRALSNLLMLTEDFFDALLYHNLIPKISLKELDDIVHASNMSKLCKSEEDAQKGCEAYRAKGVEVYYGKHNTEPYWTIYRMDGKFLKGPDFKEPDFSKFIPE